MIRWLVLASGLCLAACGGRVVADSNEPSPSLPPELDPDPDPDPVAPPRSSFDAGTPDRFEELDGHVLIGACPYVCLDDCKHAGMVRATRLDTGDAIIPVGMTAEEAMLANGFQCSEQVPLGAHLRLEALIEPGFEFVEWRTGVNADYDWGRCPCAGDSSPICELVVTERAYCGGVYRVAEKP